MTCWLVAAWLLAPQPAEAAALNARALALAQEKRLAEAEKLWLEAAEKAPEFFEALFNLGYLHYSQRGYEQAEPWLRRAVRAKPDDFNGRYLLGATLVELGRSEDGLREWRAALALRPDNVKLMAVMAVEYSKGRYFREAAAVAQRALELNPADPNLYLVAIKAYQDAGDHPSALRIAERAIRRFPNLARINFEYGFELHRAGRPQEGLPFIQKAMELAPDYEEPYFFSGEILLKEGRFEEAAAQLRRAIALRRDYMAAWVALGRALMGLKRYEEAAAELRRAIQIDPRHPHPHLVLSQVYFRMGDERRATEEKEISLRLRRENPAAMEAPQSRPFPEVAP